MSQNPYALAKIQGLILFKILNMLFESCGFLFLTHYLKIFKSQHFLYITCKNLDKTQ